jgi:hypothetical protein
MSEDKLTEAIRSYCIKMRDRFALKGWYREASAYEDVLEEVNSLCERELDFQ